MSDLLSCPFCGSSRVEIVGYFPFVRCKGCGAETDNYNDEEAAAEAWNTRAERTITPVLDDRDWPVWRCPDCGQPINRADRYCSSCGAKVTPIPL